MIGTITINGKDIVFHDQRDAELVGMVMLRLQKAEEELAACVDALGEFTRRPDLPWREAVRLIKADADGAAARYKAGYDRLKEQLDERDRRLREFEAERANLPRTVARVRELEAVAAVLRLRLAEAEENAKSWLDAFNATGVQAIERSEEKDDR